MTPKLLSKKSTHLFLLLLLIGSSTSVANRPDYSTGRRESDMMTRSYLISLGLKEDANDSEIVRLLDDPNKAISVAGLISHKKIYSAIPKLLEIVNKPNNNKKNDILKISAAETLRDLGNTEWVPQMKRLASDPNTSPLFVTHRIEAAGLLASVGDYSQFELVVKHVNDSKEYERLTAIRQLANFGHKSNPVTDKAVELLKNAAISDSVPRLRGYAVESLEKIVAKKPSITPKLLEALEANKDSQDKDLRTLCAEKLKKYGTKKKEN